MKERPILFSAPMVRAILEGRKTQTRRIIKPQPWVERMPLYPYDNTFCLPTKSPAITRHLGILNLIALCPYGHSGDQLWVRETWALASRARDVATVYGIYPLAIRMSRGY